MKILLAAPPYALMDKYYFPIGIAYVSAMLKHNGFDVTSCNIALADDWEGAFLTQLRTVKPDVVGIGGLTPSYNYMKKMLLMAKAENPSVVTVLGGGVLSSEPDIFPHLTADIGTIGEGELVSLELMTALQAGQDYTHIDGLMYRKPDGTICTNKPHAFITNLDDIPIPDYHGFDFGTCYNSLHSHDMISSRGCPFHCTFCYSPLGRGKHRSHSLGYVINEIKFLVEHFNINKIGLMDEVFALKRERILEFCDLIEPLNLKWYTQLRVEIVDVPLLKRMKQSGCFQIFYGLESMSTKVLKSMNKKLNPARIDNALNMTYQSGLQSFGNFIFGDTSETQETAWETLGWWLDHRNHFVNLGKIDCWPGTKIYHQAIASGRIKDKIKFIEEGCPITNITGMPDHDYMNMLETIWLLHEALLWPGKLIAADISDPDNLKTTCRCPHCQTDQTFERLQSTPMNNDRKANRLLCRHCDQPFDIPLRLPAMCHTAEVEALFEEAVASCRAGDGQSALNTLETLCSQTGEHPVAIYLHTAILLEAKQYGKARELLRQTLRNNPSEPFLLEIASVAYSRSGESRMGFILLGQAELLRAARSQVITPESLASLDPMEALYLKLFPHGAQAIDCSLTWEADSILDNIKDCQFFMPQPKLRWLNLTSHRAELTRFKTVVFFGAGGRFISMLDEVRSVLSKDTVVALVDNMADKGKDPIDGIAVVHPRELARIRPDLVIITSNYYDDIFKQLHAISKEEGLAFAVRYIDGE